MADADDPLALLDALLARARAAGADAADAVALDGTTLSAAQRLGEPERLERSESVDLGLRVFVGKRSAVASTSDRKPDALDALVERVMAMARSVPEDPHAGIAEAAQLVRTWPDLDLADGHEPDAEALVALADAAEAAARGVPGVTNSEGAEAQFTRTRIALAATNGFAGGYTATGSSVAVSVIAGEGTAMETDFAYTSATHGEDLEAAEAVGRRAGERAVKSLGSRKIDTARVPVVFDPRVANGFLRTLAGAISGPSIARGTSFLQEKLGERVFAPGITIVDDPHLRRGRRSKPFDAEGLPTGRRELIADGRLTTWLLDLRSARQLGLEPTGHAGRGTTSPPSPGASNLYMARGERDPAALMADIRQGFYVTRMMGHGTNMVTGDYSRGATGFWIENGEIAYPVSEVTVAGNLIDMFANTTPANDLEMRFGVDAPTLRIEGMTVAGK
ncbi:MAG: metallopeptidase TldD-related protein [Azospirillaceae bacterium]